MTSRLLRALAFNDEVRIMVIDAKELVAEAQRRHDTWQTATAALGRSLVGTALLAANLKGGDRLNVEIQGTGPLGRILCDGDATGHIRGFVEHPHVALELNEAGKIDVARGVGLPGTFSVRKYIEGSSEPFTGQVDLVSGELAEDFTYYMALSEQTPSAFGLSVLVDTDESVLAAGGFMIQMLPGASEETISALEARLQILGRFSDYLSQGLSLEALLKLLVGEADYKVLAKEPVGFRCQCTHDKLANALKLLGAAELKEMIEEDGGADLTCHFCRERYHFNESELQTLIDELESKE